VDRSRASACIITSTETAATIMTMITAITTITVTITTTPDYAKIAAATHLIG
jgi:hypothetical protein